LHSARDRDGKKIYDKNCGNTHKDIKENKRINPLNQTHNITQKH
jgi:hypothetical protein